jgi:hypothetical protein
MIETIEIYVTAQPKRKQYRLAETIPFSNQFWRNGQQIQHFCWLCGVAPTKLGQICVYCQRQFPIKKS